MTAPNQRPRIFTIGHSNRSLSEFLDLLEGQRLKLVIDVRTVPHSRHNPQFEQQALQRSLAEQGIEYRHMPGLGGLRHPKKDSINTGWRNDSFRGFADYMQTEEFSSNLDKLMRLAKRKRLVLMCAEAVPWRCHRSLIADALTARGMPVIELIGKTSTRLHQMTAFARIKKTGTIWYSEKAQ